MNQMASIPPQVVPFSLAEEPSFIERQMPVARLSAEAYKERKAIHGQVLTSLGSYWKGRKPLILARAAILGSLLPATNDPVKDLRVFLLLMGMDDRSFRRRLKSLRPKAIDPEWPRYSELVDAEHVNNPIWKKSLNKEERLEFVVEWLLSRPYAERLSYCIRPEECTEDLLDGIWDEVNAHLGSDARSLSELVRQLGIMRFGHAPRIADLFSGGGSIPFEATRIGCNARASDLNPIACMLTWGAFNVIGDQSCGAARIREAQDRVALGIESEIDELGIERDANDRRAKAYLYCVEALCPKTGYRVPLAPSWVISRNLRTVAKLIERPESRDYEIEISTCATDDEIEVAERAGTLVGDRIVHPANPDREGVSIAVVRGDRKTAEGQSANLLRRWGLEDVEFRDDDIFRERLYCIQWFTARPQRIELVADDEGEEESGSSTYFAAPTVHDLANERRVASIVRENLRDWQAQGFVPSDPIEPGEKTDEPIRTRGWTHWHHLFTPRHLLYGATALKYISALEDQVARSALLIGFCRSLNYMSRMTQWMVRTPSPKKPADVVNHVFYNQALNTFYNYGCRASSGLLPSIRKPFPKTTIAGTGSVETRQASEVAEINDIYITDPPYADAVNYHEITEYFIAWAGRLGSQTFPNFIWQSRRSLAIKGADEKFRSDMAAAYRAMAGHMPDNGLQVVMFTHQDAGVWSDLAAIMWAAGLRVTAAWNVVTETESAQRAGNYVQGTILLVLRKRLNAKNAKRMDIEAEIEDEVAKQLSILHGIDDDWGAERLYTDGDLQLAAYAAALRVITSYETIDRSQVGGDIYRKLKKGEKTVIRELIEYAASVANNRLVPEGFSSAIWRDLDSTSRFYIRMLDMEAKGTTRFADYQDFAKTFAVADHTALMGSTKANAASLAGAAEMKARLLEGKGFPMSPLRRVLFAIYQTMRNGDPKPGVSFLRTEYGPAYWPARTKLVDLARYVALKTGKTRPPECSAADLLAQKLEVDRL